MGEKGGTGLPEEVREAVVEWLRVSGRLEGMREESYVFTPLRYPGRAGTGRRAEDWVEDKPLSSDQLLRNLKIYGRRAGIGEEKLTLMALRRTAVRMMLDGEGRNTEGKRHMGEGRISKHEEKKIDETENPESGDEEGFKRQRMKILSQIAVKDGEEEDFKHEEKKVNRVDKGKRVEKVNRSDREEKGRGLEELQEFMESKEEKRFMKYRMKFLPEMPEEEEGEEGGDERLWNENIQSKLQLPVREARPFMPGEGITHGMYSHNLPPEEVRAVMEEGIEGIEEEIEGMERLGRGLLECQTKARNPKEESRLAEKLIR